MKQIGFYNYSPVGQGGDASGSVIVEGNANNVIIPQSVDNPCGNPNIFFSGDFTNLGPVDFQIAFKFADGSQHIHDLRAYETIRITNLSIAKVGIIVDGTIEVHGMGILIEAETPDDARLLSMTSGIHEHLVQGRNNHWDTYKKGTSSTATTTDVWVPSSTFSNIRLWKATIMVAGATIVTLQWCKQDGTVIKEIGQYNFTAAGSFVVDTDMNGLDNPNYNGKIQMVSSQAVSVVTDLIGTEVEYQ